MVGVSASIQPVKVVDAGKHQIIAQTQYTRRSYSSKSSLTTAKLTGHGHGKQEEHHLQKCKKRLLEFSIPPLNVSERHKAELLSMRLCRNKFEMGCRLRIS